MHFDVDRYWPLTHAVETALLGCWLVVVSRTGSRGDWAPVATMALLAALIPEILPVPSAYQIPHIPGLMPAYGGAAVLARAAVRARGLGWPALLCLAVAWSVLEEFVLCQTSIHHVYRPMAYGGHPLGINAVYLLWALGVEAVGTFLVAAQLTEVLFPDRRHRPWLSRPAAWTGGLAWLVTLPLTWYFCTYILERMPTMFSRHISPPVVYPALAGVIGLGLVAVALTRRPAARVSSVPGAPPSAWLVGVVTAILATIWLSARGLSLGGGPGIVFGHPVPGLPEIPAWTTYLVAVAIAAAALTLIPRWSASPGWTDLHRLALCAGALLGEMIQALNLIAINPGKTPLDSYAAQLEVDALVIALLVAAGLRLRHTHGTGDTPEL